MRQLGAHSNVVLPKGQIGPPSDSNRYIHAGKGFQFHDFEAVKQTMPIALVLLPEVQFRASDCANDWRSAKKMPGNGTVVYLLGTGRTLAKSGTNFHYP
jgi:hypothetical protein